MQKKFLVGSLGTDEALGRAMVFIRERLCTLKLNTKDTHRAELMCEESLLRLFRYADFTKNGTFRANVHKFFGDVMIDLTVPGEEFNFAASLELSPESEDELSPDAEAAVQNLLLRSFADNLNYRHSGHSNRITVKAYRSNYSGLYKTLTALLLAVVGSIAAKSFLHESVYMPINDNLLVAVRTIFMNGLKMCAVPVVFFSIAASASDLGNFSGFRRTGMRLLIWFLVMQVIAAIIGFGVVGFFGTGKGAGLIAQSASSSSVKSVSFIDTVVHLIPENIDRSFVEGNMLQLIVVALLAGAAAASTGAKILIQVFN